MKTTWKLLDFLVWSLSLKIPSCWHLNRRMGSSTLMTETRLSMAMYFPFLFLFLFVADTLIVVFTFLFLLLSLHSFKFSITWVLNKHHVWLNCVCFVIAGLAIWNLRLMTRCYSSRCRKCMRSVQITIFFFCPNFLNDLKLRLATNYVIYTTSK